MSTLSRPSEPPIIDDIYMSEAITAASRTTFVDDTGAVANDDDDADIEMLPLMDRVDPNPYAKHKERDRSQNDQQLLQEKISKLEQTVTLREETIAQKDETISKIKRTIVERDEVIAQNNHQSALRQLGGTLALVCIIVLVTATTVVSSYLDNSMPKKRFKDYRVFIPFGLNILWIMLGLLGCIAGLTLLITKKIPKRPTHRAAWLVRILTLAPAITIGVSIFLLLPVIAGTNEDKEFIPAGFDFSGIKIDDWLVRVLGIMNVLGVCSPIISHVSCLSRAIEFHLKAKMEMRPFGDLNKEFFRRFYKTTLVFVMVGAISQVALGFLLGARHGFQKLDQDKRVQIAFFYVIFPMMSVCAGLCQFAWAFVGTLRAWNWISMEGENYYWTCFTVGAFILTLSLQILQSFLGSDDKSVVHSTICMSAYTGIFMAVAWLDYTVRHTPETTDPSHYGYSPVPDDFEPWVGCVTLIFNRLCLRKTATIDGQQDDDMTVSSSDSDAAYEADSDIDDTEYNAPSDEVSKDDDFSFKESSCCDENIV